jgi:ATP-dependent RNA helicase DeaD
MMTVEFKKFSDLTLSDKVQSALARHTFITPTPIQRLVLPDALEGRDIFGQAQTGTGKTLAFAIPIAERLNARERYVQSIVLVPTRELAKQVATEIEKVIAFIPEFRVVSIYGGVGQQPQVDALAAGAQIVVGTPGRVADLMRQKQLSLSRVSIAVLDEVDEMLDMGFYDEVHAIMSAIPKARQTMFFSATIPPRIQKMARSYLRKEIIHTTSHENLLVETTEHFFYETPGRERLQILMRIIDCESITKALIFTNTKIDADRVCSSLVRAGYPIEGLHGDLPQSKREAVMARFRSGKTAIIVATDVAARGLDIRDLTHVIHYHIPLDPETFVHRTGRTGRAGASGRSIILVSPAEYHDLFKIQEANRLAIQNRPVPSEGEAFSGRMKKMFDKILQGIKNDDIAGAYKEMKKHVPLFKRGKALAWLAARCGEGGFRFDTVTPAAKSEDGGARLFLNIGRKHGVTEPQVREFITKESGVSAGTVCRVDIRDGYSHVSVEQSMAEKVISAVNGKKLGRYAVRIESARDRAPGHGDHAPRHGDRSRESSRGDRNSRSRSHDQGPRASRQTGDRASGGEQISRGGRDFRRSDRAHHSGSRSGGGGVHVRHRKQQENNDNT